MSAVRLIRSKIFDFFSLIWTGKKRHEYSIVKESVIDNEESVPIRFQERYAESSEISEDSCDSDRESIGEHYNLTNSTNITFAKSDIYDGSVLKNVSIHYDNSHEFQESPE